MATLTIRNVDPELREALRVRAALHGRSMEAELRDILKVALGAEKRQPEPNLAEAIRRALCAAGRCRRDRAAPAGVGRGAAPFRAMIVLDTNVLSELMRSHPAAPVFAWAAAQPRTALYTTSINKAEILYGIAVLPEGRRRTALAVAAEAMFIDDFAGRVLPFDEEAAVHYAEIITARRGEGRPIEAFYAQIAATARVADAELATAMSEISRAAASPWSIRGKRRDRDTRGLASGDGPPALRRLPRGGAAEIERRVERGGAGLCSTPTSSSTKPQRVFLDRSKLPSYRGPI